jgi:hypothetical protein
VIDKLEDTRKLMFRGSRARQAKNSWHKVRELVQAFIKVGDTAAEHRVDPALFNLVDMPAVWNKLQEELAKEGKKTAVRHYKNILQLHASFWADADTLHVAVVVRYFGRTRRYLRHTRSGSRQCWRGTRWPT